MEKANNDSKFIVKTALLTFVKSLILFVALIFLIFCLCYVFFPSSVANLYDTFGYQEGVVAAYERIYNKSQKNSDLYNLIQKSVVAKTHAKTSKYINLLKQNDDYDTFVSKTNKALIEASEPKYIAFVGDLDGYLTSELVVAEYKLGNKQNALDIATSDLISGKEEGDNIYSFSMASYLNCMVEEYRLDEGKLKNEVASLVGQTINNVGFMTHVENRELLADYTRASSDSEKILRIYTCLKIEKFKYQVYSILKENQLSSNAKEQVKVLQDAYDLLINA